jgi:hypothetical protein
MVNGGDSEMNEHEIQSLAVAALRKIGFTCCVTSNRKRTSNTKGTPDVFVHIGNAGWLAIEFKRPHGGRISSEQAKLNTLKNSYIVDNIDDAIEICLSFNKPDIGK